MINSLRLVIGLWLLTPWKGGKSTILSRSAKQCTSYLSLPTERNSRVALVMTFACMPSTAACSSSVPYQPTSIGPLMCFGHATAPGSSLARTTRQFAVGTPIQENKSDIRGRVTDSILSLSLSPDGSILASASYDKTVRFWDATTGNPIGKHLQHDERVNAVRFSPSGEFVASLGWGGQIYLWRVPWWNSVENRVRTLIRCTSVFIPIALSI